MPAKNARAVILATRVKGRRATSGQYHVEYRDVLGKTISATVLAAGSASGLKLNIDSCGGVTRIIDNVAAMTALKQTNVYILREG